MSCKSYAFRWLKHGYCGAISMLLATHCYAFARRVPYELPFYLCLPAHKGLAIGLCLA